MHTTPDQRLLEFIRKFRTDLTPEGTISRIELHHSVEGEMGERLDSFEMADRDDDEDPDDLAQEIWDVAEEDSATRATGSVQRYVVQLFRGDTREPDAQKAFTTVGKLSTALTGNGTEPPTPRGEMMQAMRERNDMHALVVRMCEATAGAAAVQLQREREENGRLREVGYKYEQLRQEMLDRQLERDLKRKDEESSQQLNQMLIGTLLQFAPVILGKLLAPAPPPGAATPLPPPTATPETAASSPPAPAPSKPIVERDRTIAELLGSVTLPQMQSLLNAFDDEQKAKFLKAYTSYRDHPPEPAPN